MKPLSQLLHIEKGLTAVIGSGGKSALLSAVARELNGKVLLCTTYYFYPFPNTAFLSLSDISPETEAQKLLTLLSENQVVCAGQMTGNGKLGRPLLPFSRLKEMADYVLVEADNARGLPLKAHDKREPDLPDETDHVICVVGAQGFMQPVADVVHHPEVFRLLTGCAEDAVAKPEYVAKAILNENLSRRILINQVETREALALSERFVNATDLDNIVVGSIQNNAYKSYL